MNTPAQLAAVQARLNVLTEFTGWMRDQGRHISENAVYTDSDLRDAFLAGAAAAAELSKAGLL